MTKEEVKQTILEYFHAWDTTDPELDHNDGITEHIEWQTVDLICEYALEKDPEYKIGEYKLSHLYHTDMDELYEEIGEMKYDLFYEWIDSLLPPESVTIEDLNQEDIQTLDQEIGELALFYYSTFWPDYYGGDFDVREE